MKHSLLEDIITVTLALSIPAVTWLGVKGYFGRPATRLGSPIAAGKVQPDKTTENKVKLNPESKFDNFDVLFEAQMRLGEEKTYPVEGNKYQISLYENVDPGMTVQIVYCFDEKANKIRDLRIPRIRVGSEEELDRYLFFRVKEHFETTELTSHDDRVHQGSIKFQLGRYKK